MPTRVTRWPTWREVMPAMDALNIGWLEEPFPAHDHRSYKMAKGFGRTPLAAGENHYTRFEFHRVIEDGNITSCSPISPRAAASPKCSGSQRRPRCGKLPIHPHSSMTGLIRPCRSISWRRSTMAATSRPISRSPTCSATRWAASVGDRQGWLRAAARRARHRRRDRREIPRGSSLIDGPGYV